MREVVFWAAFPFRVLASVVRDEITFWKMAHRHVKSKQLKDFDF